MSNIATELDVRDAIRALDDAVTRLENTIWRYVNAAIGGEGSTNVELIHRIEEHIERLDTAVQEMRTSNGEDSGDEEDFEDGSCMYQY